MVFYFTGTGNSMYVAKELENEAVSIPQAIRKNDLHFVDERIGIVAPVYGHELPGMVNDFIRRAEFETEYLYCIATYGSGHGGAGAWLEDMFRANGKKLNYANVILMPDNFLPSFDMEQERVRENRLGIDEMIAGIKEDILFGRQYILPANLAERFTRKQAVSLKHKVVTEEFLQNLYTVTESCVGCGVCEKICPAGCFHIENGKASRNPEGCQLCMACIHACPQYAIRLNLQQPNPGAHFRNSHVSLKEIMEANNQY